MKLTSRIWLSTVYTIDDEGLEKDGAVVGFAGQFVNHAGYLIAPRQRSDNRQRGTRVKDWGGAT